MEVGICVRMYRTGFGDCFLLSFGPTAAARHVLIDFGAHMHGEIGTMEEIMDDIAAVTQSKVALLIATHSHRDHISGFGKFADRFSGFDIGEVWMPWLDDPKDPVAATMQKKQLALYESLETHLRMGLAATESKPKYAAALNALANLRGNEKAVSELRRGFGTGAKVEFLAAGTSVAKVAGIPGLSAEILAPSRDKSFLSRMDPPAAQRFLTAPDTFANPVRPFPMLEVRTDDPDYREMVDDGQPILSPKDMKELEAAAELSAGALALKLNNVRNNTSLVVLFRYKQKALLFPGDAQWGSWQSWIGQEDAKKLISELDFLKVAHHGSDNATPVDLVKGLRAAGLVAMVPTQVAPYPTIPRLPLLNELNARCAGHVAVRSDWIEIAKAPSDKGPAKLPPGFTKRKLSLDYNF